MRRRRKELSECAQALLELNSGSPPELFEELIEDGLFYLNELRRKNPCNPLLVSSITYRIDRAEALRDQKMQQGQKEGASL